MTRDEALASELEKVLNHISPHVLRGPRGRMAAVIETLRRRKPCACGGREPIAQGFGYVGKCGGKLFPQDTSLVKGGCYTEYAEFIILPAEEES